MNAFVIGQHCACKFRDHFVYVPSQWDMMLQLSEAMVTHFMHICVTRGDELRYAILFYDETQSWYGDHSQTIMLFKCTYIIYKMVTVTPLLLTESIIWSLEGTWFCVTSSHSLKPLISSCHFWGKQWHPSPIITWSDGLIWHHISNRQQQQNVEDRPKRELILYCGMHSDAIWHHRT